MYLRPGRVTRVLASLASLRSYCVCQPRDGGWGWGEPSPGADVAGVSPIPARDGGWGWGELARGRVPADIAVGPEHIGPTDIGDFVQEVQALNQRVERGGAVERLAEPHGPRQRPIRIDDAHHGLPDRRIRLPTERQALSVL